LSDPTNPLSLTVQTDTATFNGRTATRTYVYTATANTRTFTDTSPANRQRTTTLDAQGRVTQQQQGNLTPTQFSYDSRGRLSTRTQGTRSSIMTYDAQGRLATITDPAQRQVQFQYDTAGRVTRQTLPDLREITYTYDPNGNVTSISPPGRPPHVFEYTTVNQEKKYTAPSVNGGGTQQTLYAYNADRQLTLITRPDGQGVQLAYDSAGRLHTQTLPTGQMTYGYAPTTGNLTTVTHTNTSTVTYTYDGSLLTSSTWSGPVTGNVTWTYDNNYRRTSQSVNGGNTVAFTYDADDLLTGAGAMTLTRQAQNGLLTGSSLGAVTDTMTYNGLGEVATYQATQSGTAILAVQYTRNNLGRITQKTETIGGVTTTYTYTYDPAGRLTEVKQNGVVTATYTYDPNSNRLSKTGTTGTQSGT
jgi:YD repeat-containing protein